jgi:hypothetical protein
MKAKVFLLAALALAILPMALPAAPASFGAGPVGLLFNAKNLLALDGFEDGYQAGAGVKYFLLPDIAARALLGVYHNAAKDPGPTKTTIGLGLAGEWHPKSGAVSPYLGALAGFRSLAQTGQDTSADFYFGALFGAEAKLLGPVSLFAEYDLVASFDAKGFTLRLGLDDTGAGDALLGIIIYI